jgi:HK97 family phage major capsid protein
MEQAQEMMTKLFDGFAGKMADASKKLPTMELSFDLDGVKGQIEKMVGRESRQVVFEIKDINELNYLAKTTSEAGSLTGDVIEGDRQAGIERQPVRRVFIEDIANVQPTTSNVIEYVEVTNTVGAPATTAELATIPEVDYTFEVFTAPVKKVTAINKHSVELLKDAPLLVAKIKEMLQVDVNLKVGDQLLTGDGVGANLNGIFNTATVLDAAAVGAKRVQAANIYDVIRLAITKITVAGKGYYLPTHVLLNPETSDEMDFLKNADGDYILPPFRSADGTMIKNVRVIENTGVAAGKFLVGDFTRFYVHPHGGAEVEFSNSDKDDFSRDIMSMKVRRRLASYVRNNDSGAFYTGDIEAVKTALTAA